MQKVSKELKESIIKKIIIEIFEHKNIKYVYYKIGLYNTIKYNI